MKQDPPQLYGRFILSPRRPTPCGVELVMVMGVAAVMGPKGTTITHHDNALGQEVWECEITLKPVRKWHGHKASGERYSTMLADGCLGDPEAYFGDLFFGEPP